VAWGNGPAATLFVASHDGSVREFAVGLPSPSSPSSPPPGSCLRTLARCGVGVPSALAVDGALVVVAGAGGLEAWAWRGSAGPAAGDAGPRHVCSAGPAAGRTEAEPLVGLALCPETRLVLAASATTLRLWALVCTR
jgi:hypothetical protein